MVPCQSPESGRRRADDRLELAKMLVGGRVLVLLAVAYLLLECLGRDQRALLSVIAAGLGYVLGRGGRSR
jgi:hypothetical protein